MSDEQKIMDIKEFRSLGLLRELNRRFLHPIGLAMAVTIDEDTNEENLGYIIDSRDDPEGFIYSQDTFETRKKASDYYDSLVESKRECRETLFKYPTVIQPLDHEIIKDK
jgi:hypothetical protein